MSLDRVPGRETQGRHADRARVPPAAMAWIATAVVVAFSSRPQAAVERTNDSAAITESASRAPSTQLERRARELLDQVRSLDANRERLEGALRDAESARAAASAELDRAVARHVELLTVLERTRAALAQGVSHAWKLRGRDAISGLVAEPDRARAARTWRNLEALVRYDRQTMHFHAARVTEHEGLVSTLQTQRADLATRESRVQALHRDVTREEEAKRTLLADMLTERERGVRVEELAVASLRELTTQTAPGSASESAGGSSAPPQPHSRFAAWKGRLPRPVDGEIVAPFGEVRDPAYLTVTHSSGVSLRAPEGAEVRAPLDGRVAYRGYVRGAGNVLILEHGESYFTVYGHLGEMRAAAGAEVGRGEVIASVGSTGITGTPEVHFEIRYRGEALDPREWLAPRTRKPARTNTIRGRS